MNAQLRVLSGPFVGETIRIDRPKFIVGREQDCQIRPDSEFVSRHHCVLLLDQFTLRIRDLGSKNGTYVNGRRITGDVVLCHDDMVAIGEMTMQVDLIVPKPAAPTIDPAIVGTGFFDGNTLPVDMPEVQLPDGQLPRVETPQIGMPVVAPSPDMDTIDAPRTPGDTQYQPPPT